MTKLHSSQRSLRSNWVTCHYGQVWQHCVFHWSNLCCNHFYVTLLERSVIIYENKMCLYDVSYIVPVIKIMGQNQISINTAEGLLNVVFSRFRKRQFNLRRTQIHAVEIIIHRSPLPDWHIMWCLTITMSSFVPFSYDDIDLHTKALIWLALK